MRLFGALLVCLCLAGCQRADGDILGETQPILAVASSADFLTGHDRDIRSVDGLSPELSASIREALGSSGRYRIVEREAFRRVMDEQGFDRKSESDRFARSVDQAIAKLDEMENMSLASAVSFATVAGAAQEADILEALAQRGSALGADYLLIGSLSAESGRQTASVPGTTRQLSQEVANGRLRLRLIDVETATLVSADSVQARVSTMANDRRGLHDALLDKLARGATGFVDDALYPASIVSFEPLLVNRGSNAGWKLGDKVEIFSRTSPIRDQGVEIGSYLKPIASVQVVDVQSEMSRLEPNQSFITGEDYAVKRLTVSPEGEDGPRLNGDAAEGFKIAVGAIQWEAGLSDRDYAPLIQDYLESALSDIGRFELVDRRRLDQSLEELEFQSFLDGASLGKNLPGLASADYLYLGRVDSFRIERTTIQIGSIGRSEERIRGIATATFQIISARTGTVTAIKRADIELMGLSGREELAQALAKVSARSLVDTLFPFEVIGQSGNGEIYINRGANWGLEVGQRLVVSRLGETMLGSDGHDYGQVETKTGVLEITAVEAERARGVLVEGEISKGNRLHAMEKASGKGRKEKDVIDW